MTPAQFARVKALFGQLCDLPEHDYLPRLHAAGDDAAIIAEVLKLLRAGSPATDRVAAPVLTALRQVAAGQPLHGTVLGAWTLEEEIGRGGMGRVFRARRSDGHFVQTAAVKLLSGLGSRAALDYLARERQILASLSHPNIARLLDGGSTPQGQPYLVMEYVDGVAIDRYCAQQRLATAALLNLFDAVCAAVSFAHQQLVVHCDLKPSNILVTPAGRPVLLDFGVSSLLGEAAAGAGEALPALRESAPAYTPRYASPEQKAGLRSGTATDIYSLGLVLAELLGARAAAADCASDNDAETLQTHALPRDLGAILIRATRPDPAARYASVAAFAADLGRWRRGQAVAARAATPLYLAQKWTLRHWPWLAAGALFLAVIMAFSWRMRVERDNALAAERAALAVKDYMISVFQGADPEISGRRDLPVSELLDAGRDGLAARLRDQPLVLAEISGILGGVYQTIGKREQALRLFDEAIALERGNQRPLRLAALLHQRAYTSYDREDFPQAEPIAREALQIRERLAADSPQLVDSLRLLGTILLYQQQREEARTLLARALALSVRISGADSVETARVHLDLGRFHGYLDPIATGAVTHARRARQIIEQRLGRDHPLYADALEILVLGLSTTQGYDEALPLARELSEKRLRFYGEISYQGGYGLYTYANLLNDAGQRLQAVPLLQRCLRIQEQLDGVGTLSSTPPLQLLARVYEGLGDYDQALAVLDQVAAIRARLLPEASRETVDLDAQAGRIRRQRGDLLQAQALLEQSLRQRSADPATHPCRLLQSQLEMAALWRQQRRLEQAQTLLDAIDPQACGKAAWRQGLIDAERARLLQARGDAAAAEALLLQAEARYAESLGAQHPDLWLLRLDRAALLAGRGETQAAAALAREIAEKGGDSIAPGSARAQRLDELKNLAKIQERKNPRAAGTAPPAAARRAVPAGAKG
ncbi:serine/threonine-protein kinase [Tahibacter harae]|uniref:Serine/threonine-protein kinase n=1 Tax=Tahibacter harae TaxID=2963937 RepID=A0ABT1QTH1_9GAMM|nr:serine/threonine-protein kinase [Tahibacter harae]MCQ4165576.1 serine/threonine-protein kinase [Tahibacter harae]